MSFAAGSIRNAGRHALILLPAGITMLAGSDPRLFVLLVTLPAFYMAAGSRFGAFLMAWLSCTTAAFGIHVSFIKFFPDSHAALGWLVMLAHAALLAIPWVFVWHPAPHSGPIRIAAALCILTLPPLGLLNWGTPLMAAGALFPGMGLIGVLATGGAMALLPSWRNRKTASALVALAVASAGLNLSYQPPPPPVGWVGINTELGRHPSPFDIKGNSARQETLIGRASEALATGAKVILFPESIAGRYRPALDVLWAPVAIEATARGSTILLGMDIWEQNGYLNALKEPGGGLIARSRVPMPIGDWKFGLAPGAKPDIMGSDLVEIGGLTAAVSICYEDFILWAHPGLLTWQADVLIAPGNQWALVGFGVESRQNVSLEALARLAGVPVISARNR